MAIETPSKPESKALLDPAFMARLDQLDVMLAASCWRGR